MLRRGQALVGLLVVGVIMIALYLLFLGPRQTADGQSRASVAKESEDRGQCVALWNNIGQINSAMNMYKTDHDDKLPASLDELKNSTYGNNFPPEMWVDPITKHPLQYDPQTGKVSGDSSLCKS